jgi:2'-5' RNA ligase
MLRLFVAVDLPLPAQQAVTALCTNLRGARFVKPHQLHVTLRFMGQTPVEELPAVRERLARAQVRSFDLHLEGVGTFPPVAGKARVLWLGLEPKRELSELAREIDDRVGDLGLRPGEKRRAFTPHLTLARFGSRPDETLAHFLARNASFRSMDWKVEGFLLYRSTLHASGAEHEVLATYPLGTICR